MQAREITEDYVRKLTIGDSEVESHFVSHFGTLMRMKLRGKLRSPQNIEDICQETFFRVLKTVRNGGLDKPERLGAFLNSVCTHVMQESFRFNTRHPAIPEEAPDPPDENADPARGVTTVEREKAVRSILDALPPRDRELLRLLYFEELDKDRICRDMKVTQEYLRVLSHRARERFRVLLQKDVKKSPKDANYSS